MKRAGRELLSELRTARTAAATPPCVYALIGAAVRQVGAGARIGVHEIAVSRYDERGLLCLNDRKSLSQEQLKQLRAEEARLARYVAEMGIDKGLFEAAAQIGHERVRYLRPERDRTLRHRPARIPREPVDDGRGDRRGRLAQVKFVVEAT